MKLTKQNPLPISWSIQDTSQNIPSLSMLINPNSLDTQYTSLITETRTLGGFVHEYWGEQLTSLTAGGKTAMFLDEKYGLSNINERQSEAYQYFMSLLNIYKNNGKDYYRTYDTVASKRNSSRITNLGSVNMFFDGKRLAHQFEMWLNTPNWGDAWAFWPPVHFVLWQRQLKASLSSSS